MATDLNRLQGELIENPETHSFDIEAMLAGLLRALLEEQEAA